MKTEVLIVGGGPIGSYLASLLSKEGVKTTIIDKKTIIGKEACSGLVSTRLKKLIPISKEFIEHKINGAILHSPNYSIKIERNKPQAYVINRIKFDQYLLRMAKNNGTKILLKTKIENFKIDNEVTTKTNKGTIKSKLLIGADGAGSSVRRMSRLKGNLTVLKGILSYESKRNSSSLVELFFGRNVSPNFFAWKIPRGNAIEYGLATNKNHIQYFKKFLKLQGLKLDKFYAHPICFGIQETASERLLLVGDAAAQVKPFSGGGIIYGLISAKIAFKAIIKSLNQNNFSKAFLEENYDLLWKKRLLSRIELGLNIRNFLNQLNDKDLNILFQILDSHKRDIKNFGDMDFL